jgi:hypothetical protein
VDGGYESVKCAFEFEERATSLLKVTEPRVHLVTPKLSFGYGYFRRLWLVQIFTTFHLNGEAASEYASVAATG